MNTNYRILVVYDEEDLCDILKFNLENEGYEVETANSAEEALKMDLTKFHLLLLDVMMGEISGFKMAKMLKQVRETRDIPIIFLTARDTENDAVTGFTLGADDYISKPFSLREVQMRIKAVLRRTAPQQALQLTKTEFEILRLLLENEGRVFSRAEILRRIWNNDAEVLDRTVDVNITRLRKKLDGYGKFVVTRLGYGYCFDTSVKD